MNKGIRTTEAELDQIPLPVYDNSYTVVKHTKALNTVRQSLSENNLNVRRQSLYRSSKGQLATGIITLDLQVDSESEAIIIFENSYDKSRSFRLYSGIRMVQSDNIILLGNTSHENYKRVHKGSANEAIDSNLLTTISNIERNFSFLVEQKNQFKGVMLDRVEIMQFLGEVFFDEELVTSEQVNFIRMNLNNPNYTYNYLGSSLFFVYMLCVSALENRGKTIDTYYDSHRGLNDYFARKLEELQLQEEEGFSQEEQEQQARSMYDEYLRRMEEDEYNRTLEEQEEEMVSDKYLAA